VLDQGRYTTFDAPSAPFILPRDINNRGQVVGFTLTGLEEPAQGARGFLLAKGVKGPFTPIDVPGAPRSAVAGINDRGQLVGFYENPDAPDPQPTGTQPRWAGWPDRPITGEETSMASTPHPRRRLRLAVAGAVVVTALTVATAGASPPTPMGDATAMEAARLGASPSRDTRASSPAPGFLLERGRFKPIAIPRGLEDLAPEGIGPTGINDRGQIVGAYADPAGAPRGFRLDRGRFTKIDVPGAMGTQPQGNNNRGQIVGKYSDVSSDVSAPGVPVRGFLLDRGRYVRLDFPGAPSSQAFGVNDRGQVVGEYKDANGRFHGYLWERGRFQTIEAGSAIGINNRGQILGTYSDDRRPLRGFVLEDGRVTRFDAPGAPITFPLGINDAGQIVGYSFVPPDLTTIRGFLLAKGAKGPFTTISRPGATATVPFDINNRGQIVGVAVNPEATPSPQPTGTPPMGRMA
jgi:probable HAF family extracellular repeat protein